MSDKPDPEIVKNWTDTARQFADAITDRFPEENAITPYIHVFVYHVGYFLQKLGNIECFANYDIESWHRKNKMVKNLATPGFGGRGTTLPVQQLQHQQRTKRRREQPEEKTDEPAPKKQRIAWTEKQLVVDIKNNNEFQQALKEAKNKSYNFKSLDIKRIERKNKSKQKQMNKEAAQHLVDLHIFMVSSATQNSNNVIQTQRSENASNPELVPQIANTLERNNITININNVGFSAHDGSLYCDDDIAYLLTEIAKSTVQHH